MEQYKIDRINELARRAKTVGLTPQEAEEQQQLRAEYRAAFRASLAVIMEHTVIQRPDGTKEKIRKRDSAKC